MVTLSSDSRPIIGHGPALGARFFFLAIASIALMVADHRGGYMEVTRSWLQTAVNPLYVVVQVPGQFWGWLTGSFSDRSRLRTENAQLNDELRTARVKLLRFDALTEENRRLRAIRNASQGMGERTLIAEIVRVDVDPYRHRVRINKGSQDGVFKGQPVLDAFGIVGQVTRVDEIGAEIILISDNEHATPVQVNRNGIRSIAVGTGDIHRLNLPFLTIESDVKPDDLLVSSGLDGIFPAGYPVATITKVERDPSATFAVVEARPLAQLDRAREVLLLWVDPSTQPAPPAPAVKPARPAPSTAPASPPPTTASPATTEPTSAPEASDEPTTPPPP
ncbi:MAG TPA: rod shape-determining protein MreC [Povalibacter sp.]|uniref:rod shape-determining protein MreC n=1 Tax=Povalibacter sp. TaxID=1962978 RepID=UPI002BEA3554|nr:rod shape-determining protein MreC [Povalibacter sp.]HMN44455.1 rod shape-determining protein MreC [Povalibacter sp.]